MGVRGFVDIHCHTLPGLDDGPKNEESARSLAAAAYAGGTLAIIATPHFSMRYAFDPALAGRALKDLERRLPEGLKLFPGCEIEVNDESLRVFFAAPRRYTLNASRYALIELMQNSFPTSMERLLGRFEETGTRPILAHPERYPRLLTQRGRLLDWVRRGCLLQITADSLSGRMGRRARTAAFEMLEEGFGELRRLGRSRRAQEGPCAGRGLPHGRRDCRRGGGGPPVHLQSAGRVAR